MFNFYTRIPLWADCSDPSDNQYEKITNYLRTNPEIFVAETPLGGTISATTPANTTNPTAGRVAYFKHLVLQKEGSNELIRAEVSLERSNNQRNGQHFSRTWRYCWYGVKARFKIRTNQNNQYQFKQSGDYQATISVLTE